MTNELYRARLISRIAGAIAEARNAQAVEHSVMQGRIREIALRQLLRPVLPRGVELGTGKIIDWNGRQSSEIDVVIYDPCVVPPLMYDELGGFGLFPAETCLYSLEVKTTISSTEVRTSIQAAIRLRELELLGEVAPTERIVPGLFAFGSNLTGTHRTELERYLEIDEAGLVSPAIPVICVVGSGYWYWRYEGPWGTRGWVEIAATPEHDEVVDFLAGVANTVQARYESRKRPPLGRYVIRNQ